MRKVGLTLVLGGARSGKSEFAEKLAQEYASVDYVGTAFYVDEEMEIRIKEHQDRRPDHWRTLETVEMSVGRAIAISQADVVMLDSMTLYVSQAIEREREPSAHLLEAVQEIIRHKHDLIVVSDEVGLGLVPITAQGRAFRDLLGWVNQLLAAAADDVYLITAGIPLTIKRGGLPLWR